MLQLEVFEDDLLKFDKCLKKQISQLKVRRFEDELLFNHVKLDVTYFEWDEDRNFKRINDQLESVQALHKSTEKLLDKMSKMKDKQFKNYKQALSDISNTMGKMNYEISNISGHTMTVRKDISVLKYTVKKMTATIQEALRNLGFGVQIMDSFRDLGYDSDENGAYNQNSGESHPQLGIPSLEVPVIAVISPTSSASSSQSSFDSIGDIPATIEQVQENYAQNRDEIQGKLAVLYETDSERDSQTDSSFQTLSSSEEDEGYRHQTKRESISPHALNELLSQLPDGR